jgi:hypothetical protein
MKTKIYLAMAALLLTCYGCKKAERSIDVYQSERNQVQDVQEQLQFFDIDTVLIHSNVRLACAEGRLFIVDGKSTDRKIHVFDAASLTYQGSGGLSGQGPQELLVVGDGYPLPSGGHLLVPDFAKYEIYSFAVDSLLADSMYLPQTYATMNPDRFPASLGLLNDTLAVCRTIQPTSQGMTEVPMLMNLRTGEGQTFAYEVPEVEKRSVTFDVKPEDSLYIEAYQTRDLMVIEDIHGRVKARVYGPKWGQEESENLYFSQLKVVGGKVFVGYVDGPRVVTDPVRGKMGNQPRQLLVFDLEGNYLKTLSVGCPVINYTYDAQENCLFLVLDGESQFARLPLQGIL